MSIVRVHGMAVGTLCVPLGALIIVFRDPKMRHAIHFRNRAFGLSFGERELRWTTLGAVGVSMAFLAFGIALLPLST